MARQAIVIRFSGPTNSNDARLTARCDAGRLTVLWNESLDRDANYLGAARALCRKLGWNWRTGKMGWLPTKDGRAVFVL